MTRHPKNRKLRIGLLLNPTAGVGGPVGLKGSDGLLDEAMKRGGRSQVAERVQVCLEHLEGEVEWLSVPGVMGGDLLQSLPMQSSTRQVRLLGPAPDEPTSPEDTRASVKLLCDAGIDLLLFAGGDGTARDVADAFHSAPALLGIPCGVKMHSGVFATSPKAAASMLNQLAAGALLSVTQAEVRDIDEASFREGVVKTRLYGELPVPQDLRYVQQTKVGGREVEALVLEEIAADVREHLDDKTLYIMGSGSTLATIMASMNLEATLLGIDAVMQEEVIARDATEQELLALLDANRKAKLLVTAISGQGHIFGRGNQQLSPEVIRRIGLDNIQIIATRSKLAGLEQRPLLVDTGDPDLDDALAGMKAVLTGYDDYVLYRVA